MAYKRDKLGRFRELSPDLTSRFDSVLSALAELDYVEEIVVERPIHHSRLVPHIEMKRSVDDLKNGFVRVALYAREGYGCLVNVVIKGVYGIREIPHYIRYLNKKPELYFGT